MDSRPIDILRIMLENNRMRYRDIVSKVLKTCDWRLSEDSTKTTVSNILDRLVHVFLKKENLGHKNVWYSFKSEKAKEKARLIVFSQPRELKKVVRDIIEADPAGLLMLPFFPSLIAHEFGCYIAIALKEKRFEDLRFRKERVTQVISAFYESLLEILEDRNNKESLKAVITSIEGEEIISDCEKEVQETPFLEEILSSEGLTRLLNRKYELTYRSKIAKNKEP
jgi:predicted P-loop ATPase/GTPase